MTSSRSILIVGQASQETGLARVTRAIAKHLAPHYDVHVLGIDTATPARNEWTLHNNPSALDCYAELRLTDVIDEIRPSVVLLYNDLAVISRYFPSIERARHHCPIAGYCPIDGRIAHSAHVKSLAPLDALVVFTEFARKTVQQCAWQEHLAVIEPFRSVRVIPHGLDGSAFYPMGRLQARQALFPDRPDLWDGFWILNANRNQPRKRLDLTLQGFARFAADKPANVRLYLHTGLNEIGIDIMREARALNIEDRLILTHRADNHPASTTSSLNFIYNACDVGVNTATGEGWGLISCEHAATRAAQTLPRHSACEEIWDGAAELLPSVASTSNDVFEGGIIDPSDLANGLQRLYSDPLYCQSRSHAAYERITRPEYHWKRIAIQWRTLLDELIDRKHDKEACNELHIRQG